MARVYLRHLDDLSTAETQLLVIIQHSVHALNPQSVHGAIKHVPLLVRGVVGHALSDETGYDSVSPVYIASI